MAGNVTLLYTLTDAVKNIKANRTTAVLSALTVAFALAIFALFIIIFVNLSSVLDTWGDKTSIVVYVKDWGVKHGAPNLKDRVEKIKGVESVVYISKKQAFEILEKELKGHEEVLEGVSKNVLPASLEIKISETFLNPEGINAIVKNLKKIEWVEDVEYGTEWVEKFSAFVRFMAIAAIGIGFFLTAATIFIISNTIRLTVYARKDEIEVMRYLGATDTYIKIPFFVEGMIAGGGGGVIALFILLLGRYVLGLYIPAYFAFILESPFTTVMVLIVLTIAGLVIGGVGSLVSLGRFLKV